VSDRSIELGCEYALSSVRVSLSGASFKQVRVEIDRYMHEICVVTMSFLVNKACSAA
jgi:hypothetical protein